jgi:hypothetical protein
MCDSIGEVLGYSFQTAFKRLTGEAPKQLATTLALTAIALQTPQSLWGRGSPN